MNTNVKILLIVPNLLLLVLICSAQTKDHTPALNRIYKKITTDEERAQLAAENPEETFLAGNEIFGQDSTPVANQNTNEDLPIGNVMQYDELAETQENTTTAEIYQVMEFHDFENPIDNDPSKPVKESGNVIMMEEYDPVIAAQPVAPTTSVETKTASNATFVESSSTTSVETNIDVTPTSSVTSEEMTTKSVAAPISTMYQIQLGYFGNIDNANRMVEKTKTQYSEPISIAEDYKKGKVYYRVLLGGFDNLKDAQKLYRTIRKNGAKATIKKQ